MNEDSIQCFLKAAHEMSAGGSHVWMGAFVASYDLQEASRKIEVSQYGSFFRDDKTGKYFELPPDKKDDWQEFCRECYKAAYSR